MAGGKPGKTKRLNPLVIIVAVVVLSLGIYAGTRLYSNHYVKSTPGLADCRSLLRDHTVSILDDTVNPSTLTGEQCDTLTIVNNDNKVREIAFGQHDAHTAYDGVTEKVLQPKEGFTVTLNQTGTFLAHDHLQDSVQLHFTVTPQAKNE